MWPLTRLFNRSRKDYLNGIKTITVNGLKVKIKKINPLMDFDSDKIPQIFSYYLKRRKAPEPENLSIDSMKKNFDDMKNVVKVGIVEPRLSPETITIDELFRWGDTGTKLYLEIIAHSLNQFSGLKGVFFSIRIRRLLFTSCQKAMENFPLT